MPGPWRVTAHTPKYVAAGVVYVATVFDNGAQKGNAYLIAAAPDLYEALSAALARLHSATNNNDEGADRLYEQALAALNRARGES